MPFDTITYYTHAARLVCLIRSRPMGKKINDVTTVLKEKAIINLQTILIIN